MSSELRELSRDADERIYESRGFEYELRSITGSSSPGLARALGVVSTALLGMLAVACANVLLLAHAGGARRARALEVLQLVGGTPRRLATLLGFEAVLGALIGAVGGIALATASLRLIQRFASLPSFVPVDSLDPRVTTLVASGCAVLLAVAHATTSASLVSRSRRSSGTARSAHASMARGKGLIVLQVSFALALVVGAATLDGAVRAALSGANGFRSSGLVSFDVYPMPSDYPDGRSREFFFRRLEERLTSRPEVEAATGASALPFSGGSTQVPVSRRRPLMSVDPDAFSVAEWTGFDGAVLGAASDAQLRVVDLNVAQPGFFSVMGIPVPRGREFEYGDSASGKPVIVISEDLASSLWGRDTAVGDSLWVVGRWRRVVGIAPRTALHGLVPGELPQAWIPQGQVLGGRMSMVIATSLSIEAATREVQTAVREIDPRVPVGAVTPVRSLVQARTSEERFMSTVVAVFSAVSLLLAGLATYGLLAWLVAARRKDMAVRIALGGSGRQVGLTVVREGLMLSLIGTLLGAASYLLLELLLHPLAFAGSPRPDLGRYLLAAALCLSITALAATAPGRRAAKTEPLRFLVGP